MPNIKSAKKRVRVIAAKTARNKAIRSDLRTTIKKANVALETAADTRAQSVKAAVKKLDKAVSKGILHKNTAARKKSQLVRGLNKAG